MFRQTTIVDKRKICLSDLTYGEPEQIHLGNTNQTTSKKPRLNRKRFHVGNYWENRVPLSLITIIVIVLFIIDDTWSVTIRNVNKHVSE